MRRSIVFATDAFEALVPLARRAEDAGMHRVWTTEYTGRDAVARALMIALATSEIGVASGIAYAFTRPPVAAAALAADVYVASRGRFVLGLGAGTRGMRTRWYDADFDHPAPRLAEYVALLRACWAPEPAGLDFDGRFYRTRIPGFVPGHDPAALRGLAVYGSGLNAMMLRSAAQSCDGVALHPLAGAPGYLERTVAPAMAAGARRGGRSPALACWLITSVDHDPELALRRARRQLAFYFSTPSYAGIVEGTAWEGAVVAIQERHREVGPRWDEIADLVPSAMASELTLTGTPDSVSAELAQFEARFREVGADEVVFQTVGIGISDEEAVANCEQIIDLFAADR